MTQNPNQRVLIGVFDARTKADAAVIALKHLGFTNDEIGVLARRTEEWNDITTVGDAAEILSTSTSIHQIGGLWTLGLAAVVLPTAGPIVVGGVFAEDLATAWSGTAIEGICGALVGMEVSASEAKLNCDEVMAGGTLIVVRAGNRLAGAIAVLKDYGGMVSKSEV